MILVNTWRCTPDNLSHRTDLDNPGARVYIPSRSPWRALIGSRLVTSLNSEVYQNVAPQPRRGLRDRARVVRVEISW